MAVVYLFVPLTLSLSKGMSGTTKLAPLIWFDKLTMSGKGLYVPMPQFQEEWPNPTTLSY